jgi:hypothetical protein
MVQLPEVEYNLNQVKPDSLINFFVGQVDGSSTNKLLLINFSAAPILIGTCTVYCDNNGIQL